MAETGELATTEFEVKLEVVKGSWEQTSKWRENLEDASSKSTHAGHSLSAMLLAEYKSLWILQDQ